MFINFQSWKQKYSDIIQPLIQTTETLGLDVLTAPLPTSREVVALLKLS